MKTNLSELEEWVSELQRIERTAGTSSENIVLEVDGRMAQIHVLYPRGDEA